MSNIQILIADNQPIFRKGLTQLLKMHPGWKVVAEAGSGRDAVEKARQIHPDIAILDVTLPELNGLDAARLISRQEPNTRILMLTMHDDDELIADALQAGIRGYLLKTEPERDIVNAVETVLEGRTFFPEQVYDVIFSADRTRGNRRRTRLSPREAQVLGLLAEGKRNREVAESLNISTRTVENHRARIMERLKCHSVSELVRYAIRHKMLAA